MKLTQRGLKLLTFSTILLLIALAYNDFMAGFAFTAMASLSLYDLFRLRALIRASDKLIRLRPSEAEVRVEAGRSVSVSVEADSKMEAELACPYEFTSLEPGMINGRSLLTLHIAPNLAGNYEVKGLKARVRSPLGIFSALVQIPFYLNIRVYPRLLRPLMEALRALQGLGPFGESEAVTNLVGNGLEYAWSRPYQLGDRVRRIDWKATARTNELYIKTFFREGGPSARVVYDVRVPGPVSLDQVSATMLSTVTQLAILSTPLSLTILGDEITNFEDLEPREALRLAIRYVLQYVLKEPEEVFEYLEPPNPRLLRELKRILKDERLRLLIEGELKGIGGLRFKAEEVFWVSSITHDLPLIVDVAHALLASGGRMYVFATARPWLDAGSLEEAYRMKERFRRVVAWLDRAKVLVIKDASKIPLLVRY
jgi:uncharacterized protein (DUF58 family)